VSFVAPAGEMDRLRQALAGHAGVGGFERAEGEEGLAMLTAFPKDGKPMLAELGAIARGTGIRIDEIREERGRLDEVFRAITTGKAA
jgi:ABC-2 type transport system ATP-binding protein